MLGAIRVAPDARLAELHLEDAEVAQLDGLAVGEAFREVIEGALNDVEDILLHHAGLIADTDNQIAFGQIRHKPVLLRQMELGLQAENEDFM